MLITREFAEIVCLGTELGAFLLKLQYMSINNFLLVDWKQVASPAVPNSSMNLGIPLKISKIHTTVKDVILQRIRLIVPYPLASASCSERGRWSMGWGGSQMGAGLIFKTKSAPLCGLSLFFHYKCGGGQHSSDCSWTQLPPSRYLTTCQVKTTFKKMHRSYKVRAWKHFFLYNATFEGHIYSKLKGNTSFCSS